MGGELFESRQVAKLVGIPERTLRYWATIKVLVPAEDASGRPGIRRRYSFKNVVEAAILRELSKQRISINFAGEALSRVAQKEFETKLFCYLLIIGGNRIEAVTEDDLFSDKFQKYARMLREATGGTGKPKVSVKCNEEEKADDTDRAIALWGVAKYILDMKEATLIIPVHSLRDEMSEKVEAPS